MVVQSGQDWDGEMTPVRWTARSMGASLPNLVRGGQKPRN
jgi:hypothetical protein